MKVADLETLCIGDVIITTVAVTPIGYVENLVTWVRRPEYDGERDVNDPTDFDIMLMDDNGEVCHITDISSIADCEYSHNAFKFGAKRG